MKPIKLKPIQSYFYPLMVGIFALGISMQAQAQTVKVGIGAEPYPPFSSLDSSGKWVGWEIDFVEAVCAAGNLDCQITPIAWDGIIPALTAKQIDTIMGSMSITEERMKTVNFSNPYYNTPAVIVAEKRSNITPDAKGLKGKILGVQVSTIHLAYAQKYFADHVDELKIYQTQDEINQDLVAGRIDATLADAIALEAFLKANEGACCESKGPVAFDEVILGSGVGAAVRKEDDALLNKLNAAIKAVIDSGERDNITKRYFDAPIY